VLSQPGKHALTMTVSADGEVDLLTATLEHGMTASQAAAPRQTSPVAMAAGALKERWRTLEDAIRQHHDRTEAHVQRLDKRIDDVNQTLGGLRVLSGGRGRE
jgi:predicted secreted Zn-dependent protease